MKRRLELSDAQWRERLTAEQYRVTRQGGTEPAFSGELWNSKEPGLYHCVGCDAALYGSEAKFDSGTGWPSYWQAVDPAAVELRPDDSLGVRRTEVRCNGCGAHLGHVFPDGPEPTGERHCINSAALRLVRQA